MNGYCIGPGGYGGLALLRRRNVKARAKHVAAQIEAPQSNVLSLISRNDSPVGPTNEGHRSRLGSFI